MTWAIPCTIGTEPYALPIRMSLGMENLTLHICMYWNLVIVIRYQDRYKDRVEINKYVLSNYRPQQRALTIGFMCIIACDCNKRPTLSANSLREFAIDADHALAATAKLCGIVPWGELNFSIIQFILPRYFYFTNIYFYFFKVKWISI